MSLTGVEISGGSVRESTFEDIVEAFFACARAHPERPAVRQNGRAELALSYGQLAARVAAMARRLGDDPGPVAVLTERSPDTIVAMLGVLAAGGIYCPVDPKYPAARRTEMIESIGCRFLVGTAPDEVPAGVAVVGVPADARDDADPARIDAPRSAVTDAGRGAYVLFTSGSTGKPKPVMTPRRAIAAAVRSLREMMGMSAADRVLQFASLNWDTCFEEILTALTSGAALVFHDDAHSGSFPRMLRMIEREEITVLDLPTAMWRELVRHLAEEGAGLPDPVRLVIIGGEAVDAAAIADWSSARTEHVRLVNTYGCTETTLVTHAVDLCGPDAPGQGAWWGADVPPPIGRALPHVVEALDDDGQLLVAGPALATGYIGMEEATADRFRVRDLGDGPLRYFHTGDRVERVQDGMLSHRGRLDQEIKIRGIRVDPGEVEAHIARHPAVSAVAVVGVQSAGRATMVAYVVPASPEKAETVAKDVIASLRASVPAHLVPGRARAVPELVYTSSGKVDRAGTHRKHAS
ncbi:amino acid adenylation domain-containing protein [Saccharopolyspora kobensis]|uniref:Amino acid adenylation domain-containing protein n=1 Tax=Saccharopolyspora kobensis TaxID=146035 RepID=A0A1H5UXK6_9PSEU|nr:AMP-binding protein [Saccharopolyspora kobensis]SEF79704.1 amino acid adenylation domain-containing protein [Saccharopolyspora kobensis]SFC67812.1 nonribosomal peptide synthetase protein VioO [Saccharopolyspora kobensis]